MWGMAFVETRCAGSFGGEVAGRGGGFGIGVPFRPPGLPLPRPSPVPWSLSLPWVSAPLPLFSSAFRVLLRNPGGENPGGRAGGEERPPHAVPYLSAAVCSALCVAGASLSSWFLCSHPFSLLSFPASSPLPADVADPLSHHPPLQAAGQGGRCQPQL